MPAWGIEILADTATQALAELANHLREATQASLQFGAAADYAFWIEFGTRRMIARPFLRPALDANQQRILDAILVGALNGTVLQELAVVGQDMVDMARSIVVVRTGFLRDSIFAQVA